MASHFRTDPGSAVSPVCCSCPLTDWHQSVSEADHHLGGSYHRKINPSLDWIMITLHFHVPGNHVFLFMWHRDIRELINRCFLAIGGCECVYECTDRSVSLRCSWFQGVCRKCSGGGQDVGEVFGVADLAGRQPLTYPLTSSLSLIYSIRPPECLLAWNPSQDTVKWHQTSGDRELLENTDWTCCFSQLSPNWVIHHPYFVQPLCETSLLWVSALA